MLNKRNLNTYRVVHLLLIGFVINGCVESFEPETEVFEDALVIEATITNEVKEQEVLLNRAFRFEDVPTPEQNANVVVVDDLSNEYVFQEVSPGTYRSMTNFGAEPGRSYRLLVTTNEGREYASNAVLTPQTSPIQGLKANRVTGERDGMEILVEYDNSQTSVHYRYRFEETYKIVAPDWTGSILRPQGPGGLMMLWPIEREEHFCYNTEVSKDIILNRPQQSNLSNVLEFPVRFIDRNNYILSHRYSILVKQFVISEESYTYLKTLDESSGGEDLFSPSQPGFFRGNVYSESNVDEKVLGFFHVATVSSQRIFFNYSDFFPNEALPPFVDSCIPFKPPVQSSNGEPTIFQLVTSNTVRYHSTTALGEFVVVPRICADCTVLGDPNVPEFWEE